MKLWNSHTNWNADESLVQLSWNMFILMCLNLYQNDLKHVKCVKLIRWHDVTRVRMSWYPDSRLWLNECLARLIILNNGEHVWIMKWLNLTQLVALVSISGNMSNTTSWYGKKLVKYGKAQGNGDLLTLISGVLIWGRVGTVIVACRSLRRDYLKGGH